MEHPKRQRKKNFSVAERRALINGVKENFAALFAKLDSGVDYQMRSSIWANITLEVGHCGSTTRTVVEIKKKWQDEKKSAKQKKMDWDDYFQGNMAGSPPKDETEIEKLILSFLPEIADEKEPDGYEAREDTPWASPGTSETSLELNDDENGEEDYDPPEKKARRLVDDTSVAIEKEKLEPQKGMLLALQETVHIQRQQVRMDNENHGI